MDTEYSTIDTFEKKKPLQPHYPSVNVIIKRVVGLRTCF